MPTPYSAASSRDPARSAEQSAMMRDARAIGLVMK
jgi:hypothetical protein